MILPSCKECVHDGHVGGPKQYNDFPLGNTVEPLYYGHQGDRNKCPYYRGVRFREVGFIWFSVSQGPNELSVIERCP